jgi:hypothetical protein
LKKKIKFEDYTKRLQKLVKTKKTPIVVYKEGTYKTTTSSNSESADNYAF